MMTVSINMILEVSDMGLGNSGGEPFSLCDLTERCRNGAMPSGYIDAMLARQRRIHAALFTHIGEAIKEAEKVGSSANIWF